MVHCTRSSNGMSASPRLYLWVKFFSIKQQNYQISLHLHENWLTYQMDSAHFKYEVKNSVKCHDVASLAALPTLHHDLFIIYFI